MCNQWAHFLPDLSLTAKPLRELLNKDVAWLWLDEHEVAFKKIKSMVTSDLCLTPYDPNKETDLVVDALRSGVGFLLLQPEDEQDDGQMKSDKVKRKPKKIMWAGSTALSPAQFRYPPIMLELLAVVFALESCDFYLRAAPRL